MKDLIKVLEDQEKNKDTNDFRAFKCVKAGNYELSVQGSIGHYCSPRKTYHARYYSSMELAIFKAGKWLHNAKSSIMRSFPRYNELVERSDSKFTSCQVFGYVDVDLLNDLYLYLKNIK